MSDVFSVFITLDSRYKHFQCKEHLLKRNNFEIPVLVCTVLYTNGYKEQWINGTI